MRFDRNQPATRREGSAHRSFTRTIGYKVEWTSDVSEYTVREVLLKHPSVRVFGSDTGFIWWEGNPGPDMRAAKREVLVTDEDVEMPAFPLYAREEYQECSECSLPLGNYGCTHMKD